MTVKPRLLDRLVKKSAWNATASAPSKPGRPGQPGSQVGRAQDVPDIRFPDPPIPWTCRATLCFCPTYLKFADALPPFDYTRRDLFLHGRYLSMTGTSLIGKLNQLIDKRVNKSSHDCKRFHWNGDKNISFSLCNFQWFPPKINLIFGCYGRCPSPATTRFLHVVNLRTTRSCFPFQTSLRQMSNLKNDR